MYSNRPYIEYLAMRILLPVVYMLISKWVGQDGKVQDGAKRVEHWPVANQWHNQWQLLGMDEYLVTTIPKDPYPSLE